jgi:hypothetical protein
VGNLRERNFLEDLCIEGRLYYYYYYETGSSRNSMGSMEWVDLAQDRDIWWTVNVVMNFGFHKT